MRDRACTLYEIVVWAVLWFCVGAMVGINIGLPS